MRQYGNRGIGKAKWKKEKEMQSKVCAELEIIKSSYTLFSVLVIGYSNFSV